MTTDGYVEFLDKETKFKFYTEKQYKTNKRLQEIALEISKLPKLPRSMDIWIDSWTDPRNKSFDMQAYSKHLKIKKEYTNLVENSEHNIRELKILAIDSLIDKIKKTINTSD